jgi:imidazolonepropionase-like amidohydrolase
VVIAARLRRGLVALAALLAVASPARSDEPARTVVRVDRVITVDDAGQVHQPGQLEFVDGRIDYVGPVREPADGAVPVQVEGWALPGFVDLHSHIVVDGWGGINDSVLPLNSELSTAPTIVPGNKQIRVACAAGVTTQFLIPGSGSSISGFGVLLKSRLDGGWREALLADPGGVKVAQAYNPERRSGDLGLTRAGLYWLLTHENRRAIAVRDRGVRSTADRRLADLARVHSKELPVLIHTAGSDGVGHTVRMWAETYDVRSILSHGSFDGYKLAAYAAREGIPVNHGPRTFDTYSREPGIVPTARIWGESGGPNFSLNTDAPVVEAHELFLQGSTAARQGLDGYATLRALTIHPARSIGIGDRVGSLEVGKDADVVVFSGDPLDPRTRVERVWVDGALQYTRADGRQLF